MIKVILTALLVVATNLITGCTPRLLSPDAIHMKSSAFSELTNKVQAEILYGTTDSQQLYVLMYKKYPELMKQFSQYTIFVKEENGTAVALMCDSSMSKALLEDSTCTGTLDSKNMFEQNLTCTYHLDLNKICR